MIRVGPAGIEDEICTICQTALITCYTYVRFKTRYEILEKTSW